MNGFGIFVYWFFAIFAALGVAANILLIDKPRLPITRGMAVSVMIFGTIEVLLLLNAVYSFMF